jgi:hypothetical protein
MTRNLSAAALFLSLVAVSTAADCQVMDVSLAPESPSVLYQRTNQALEKTVALFRFTVSGAPVELNGFVVHGLGPADYQEYMQPTNGIVARLDNRDGKYEKSADVELARAPGSVLMTLNFAHPIKVDPAEPVEVWIREAFNSRAQGTFIFAITEATEVFVSAGFVHLGNPAPEAVPFTIEGFPGGDPNDRAPNIPCQLVPGGSTPVPIIVVGLAALRLLLGGRIGLYRQSRAEPGASGTVRCAQRRTRAPG